MKKKFWASIALCLALALPLGLTACGDGNDGNSTGVYTYATAYAAAADLGYEGTLEEFIEMISGKDGKDGKDGVDGKDGKDGVNGANGKDGTNGKDGVGIKSVTMNSDGELVITGTNDEILFQGKAPACKHNYVTTTYVDSTCTEKGFWKETCSKCGAHEYNLISEKGHTLEKKINLSHPANCGEKGDCLFVCSVCSTTVAAEFYGEHDYQNGVCTLCGAEKGSEGLEYKLSPDYKTYSVVRLGECTDKDIIIPKDYNGLPVTKIERNAFFRTNITSVKIPSNITEIGTVAFYSCAELKSVDIAYGVTKIGNGAFLRCQKLEEITIPDSVTEIGTMAFYFCKNLKAVKLSNNLKNLKSQAFRQCESLTEISIPDGVTEIGSTMFANCTNLKSVVLVKNLTYISSSAFDNCPALESIYFKGTAQQWEELNKPYKIPNLENVTVYFYSETEPESEGNYWHYVNDKPEIWS